jgi:predicted metal-dependent hydrolase
MSTEPAVTSAQTSVVGPDGRPVDVVVRRSTRRRRTVSAYRDGSRVVVLLPARLRRADEQRWVQIMVARVVGRDRYARTSDDELTQRAQRLSARYLDGRAAPTSVRWVANQGRRWGSCTVEDASIRLSHRLRAAPGWVLDYVLLHELAHLLEPGHGPAFWHLLAGYPRLERARGYLEGLAAASVADPGSDRSGLGDG